MEINGGCFCGAVRYRCSASEPADVATCHCSECRRSSGGTHITWLTVPEAQFQWTRGTPARMKTNPRTTRHFCDQCGTQLTLKTDLVPTMVDITVGSTDLPDRLPPTRHIWVRNRLPWVQLNDGLVQEQEERL